MVCSLVTGARRSTSSIAAVVLYMCDICTYGGLARLLSRAVVGEVRVALLGLRLSYGRWFRFRLVSFRFASFLVVPCRFYPSSFARRRVLLVPHLSRVWFLVISPLSLPFLHAS